MPSEGWKNLDPLTLFNVWLTEAKANSAIREPTAMALATHSKTRGPSNRIVLMKAFSQNGISFYTNYLSPKGLDLSEEAEAAALFYWDPIAKQVRISGSVERMSRADSETYWKSRARDSQLSQFISHQSEIVKDRNELEEFVRAADAQFKDKPIPCPPHWGGYLLHPKRFEFWQNRPGRLHDRLQFERNGEHWTSARLYP